MMTTPTDVTNLGQNCHAGGRGFESRRSRPCSSYFWGFRRPRAIASRRSSQHLSTFGCSIGGSPMACPLAFRDRQQPRPPFDRYKLGRPPPPRCSDRDGASSRGAWKSGVSARTLEAQRGEVDLVDGLEDLTADAGREEVCFQRVEERRRRCGVAQEIGFERPVGGVASWTDEPCRGGELAVVDGIVEVGVVAVATALIERPSKR